MTKNKWTLEKIKEGFGRFFSENGRYPTASEVDTYRFLPSSRQIQRRFDGLPNLRTKLGLSGQTDFTKGEYSSLRAKNIGKRAHEQEKIVYDYLVKRFGKPFVHREFFFTDDKRTRTDFFIYCRGGNFAIDSFFPKDRHNLSGCLNSKMRTYSTASMIEYPVIFLMLNDDIGEVEINHILLNKKNKLKANQRVMTFEQLETFCKTKEPMKEAS